MAQIKISSGEMAEITTESKVTLIEGVAKNVGPHQVRAIQDNLVELEIEGEVSFWDGVNIASVMQPNKEQEEVDLGTTKVIVDKEAAEIIKALLADNKSKQELIVALQSGDEFKSIQEQLIAAQGKISEMEASKSLSKELVSKIDLVALQSLKEELIK